MHIKIEHMLWVLLFNFLVPKHIAKSFLLAYFPELKLRLTNILQSKPELSRILFPRP